MSKDLSLQSSETPLSAAYESPGIIMPDEISAPVARALAAALTKIEAYVPTNWVDNSEPDIDAAHLNHAEQAIMRVTDLVNKAADAINQLNGDLDTAGIFGAAINHLPLIDCSTVDAMTEALNACQQNAQNLSAYFGCVRAIDLTNIPSDFPLGTAVYFMIGFKYNSNGPYGYGVQIFVAYGTYNILIRKYVYDSATWEKVTSQRV